MKRLLRRIRQVVQWTAALFFGTTILAVVVLKFFPVYYTPLMFIRLFQLDKPRITHTWVPLSEMSPQMPLAVMASEDARFASHHGFDFKAIKAAAERNARHPEKNRLGASTISQQTAKNVFLWPGRSWLRKGLEAYFTVLIELLWSKERIMEVYLNSIETAPGVYGVQAVARAHFGCDASQLSAEQCALIAATLPNPRRFSSKTPSPYMKKRQRWILNNMRYVEPL
ncbi:MAG: monofunctional biosynthetic peptidoglycan transglycosylase [Prevotella sp.]|nr:monofunctional biosynthetic peptidoglycan transglycosylase [Prevotella sp.]